MQPNIANCQHCGYSVQPQNHFCTRCGGSLHPSVSSDLLRLNPFAFPRDTDFRLILLIISVLGTNLFIYGNLYNSTSGRVNFIPLHCALYMLGGSLLLIVVAVGIYWFQPEWEIRKRYLQIILEDEDVPAGIKAYLTNLCREVGITYPPIFLWNAMEDDGGQAFGRVGRIYVYLSGALVSSFNDEGKRPAFRATVLHELAHIYNTDIHRTSLSIAVWYAFLFVSLPIFVITLLGSPLERIVKMSWRTFLLSLLIYLTWCAIWRVREFYADVQASKFDGFSNTLSHIREEEHDRGKKENFLPQAWLKIWHRVALRHPSAKERSRILENPTPLMDMGFWDAFATGMAMMTAFLNVGALVMFLLLSAGNLKEFGMLIFVVPALIFAPVVIYVIGVGTWRITLTEMVRGKRVHGIRKLALGLACGMVIGLQTSFIAASRFMPPIIIVLLIALLLLCILTITMFLFFNWMALGASIWLPIAIVSPSPRPFYRWGLAVAGIVLGSLLVNLCLTYLGAARSFFPHLIMVVSPLTTLSLVCLWGFPLAAWFWHKKPRQDTSASGWLFIDGLPQLINLPRQPHLKPSLAVIIGLISGSVGSLALFILLPGAKLIGWNTFNFLLAGSICIQIIAAVIVTIYVRDLSSLHGLFGTFVAGCVLAVGVVGIMLTAGIVDTKDVLFVALMIVNSGGLLALPTVLIVSALAGLLPRTMPQMV